MLFGVILMVVFNLIVGCYLDKYGFYVLLILGIGCLFLGILFFVFLGRDIFLIYVLLMYCICMIGILMVLMLLIIWGIKILDREFIFYVIVINNIFC